MSSTGKKGSRQTKGKAVNKRRYQARVRGRGGFWTDARDFFIKPQSDGTSRFNKGASAAARALGNYATPGFGDMIAPAASWLSKAFGMGKYKIRKNSLLHEKNMKTLPYVSRPPGFEQSKEDWDHNDLDLCHEEFLFDLNSSTNFNSTLIVNNPGSPSFPFLSQIAQFYEQYEWLGLIYTYKSTSSMATGSGPMGTVVMATEFDCVDAGFSNKRQMESSEYCSSAVPYKTIMHPVECAPNRNVLGSMMYTLPGVSTVAQASTSASGLTVDPRFSIPSVTTIATVGNVASGQILGEVWASYHVRLSKPIVEIDLTADAFSQAFLVTNGGTGQLPIISSGEASSQPQFNIGAVAAGQGQVVIANPAPANELTGAYQITFAVVGSGMSVPPTFVLANPWAYDIVDGSTFNFGATNGTTAVITAVVKTSNANAGGMLTVSMASGWTAATVIITSYNELLHTARSLPKSAQRNLANQLERKMKKQVEKVMELPPPEEAVEEEEDYDSESEAIGTPFETIPEGLHLADNAAHSETSNVPRIGPKQRAWIKREFGLSSEDLSAFEDTLDNSMWTSLNDDPLTRLEQAQVQKWLLKHAIESPQLSIMIPRPSSSPPK